MKFDVSFGRWPNPSWRLSVVRLGPGWVRLEWWKLAVEVDDQPTPRKVAVAGALAAAAAFVKATACT